MERNLKSLSVRVPSIILLLAFLVLPEYVESASITELAIIDTNKNQGYAFRDNEVIGLRIKIALSSPSELPATFSFTVRNPEGNVCLTIGNYKVDVGQNYCGGQVLNIPVSRFFNRQGTYTLTGNVLFASGQSLSDERYFFISDTSPPSLPGNIYDAGDTTNDPTRLTCNWASASDPQSDIKEYRYCLGTSPGMDNIVSWRSCGPATSITHTGLSLSDGTTYYFTVKAVNGADSESSPACSDGITYRAVSSSLLVTVTPSAVSFARDETTKSTTLNLLVSGASGVTLNRLIKRFTYSDGTIEEFPAESISLNISAASSLEQLKEIVITPDLRTRVLAGKTVGTFTISYEFSGYDAYSNPVKATVSILVELCSSVLEEETMFSISAISLQLPAPYPLAYNLNDEVYPDLRITATGRGDITGRIFIDDVLLGEFSQNVSGNTTIRPGSITTSIPGRHRLRIEMISPTFLSTEITYTINEAEDPISRLSELVLFENIAKLSSIDASAILTSGHYILNGSGNISITPLGIINLPVKIQDLEISVNPTEISRSTLYSGRICAQKLLNLFNGSLS